MQIFKRLAKKNITQKAQNLMEFIFVMPLLLFMTLAIFEVSFFWQEVNAIYSLNTEINANVALTGTDSFILGQPCQAADDARAILEAKDSAISFNNPGYTKSIETIEEIGRAHV